MKLEKINHETYCNFIISIFNKYKKTISAEIANEMLEWTNVHTYYVQQLCNHVFAATIKNVTADLWKNQAYQLLNEQQAVFFTHRNMLTRPQWQLLKAMAHEGAVYQPTANVFLNKYHLGTSATVLRSLKTLLNYELIVKEFDANGNPYYSVYDVFMQRWAELSI